MTLIEHNLFESTTAEGRLLEAATLLQALEALPIYNTNKKNIVNMIVNTDAQTVSISATLPINYRTNEFGQVVIEAKEYLASPTNTPLPAIPTLPN